MKCLVSVMNRTSFRPHMSCFFLHISLFHFVPDCGPVVFSSSTSPHASPFLVLDTVLDSSCPRAGLFNNC